MLRASALFYAVTVALLIGMVSGALLLLAHFRDVEMEHWLAQERATANARSAVQLACVRDLTTAPMHALDLFEDGQDSVFVRAEPYGMLERVAVRARVADDEVELSAFIGAMGAGGPVLVLGGSGTGGVGLGGDARLLGDVVVPGGDVRRAYIEGRPFTGERLVEGAIRPSPPGALELPVDLLERASVHCRRRSFPSVMPLTLEELRARPDSDEVFRSCPVVDLQGLHRLEHMKLHGPLVLRSSDTLEIGTGVQLDMVVVEAPFIAITTQQPCVLQCFAERGIAVGAGAVLDHPSALVVVPPAVPGAYGITIDSAVVEGTVVVAAPGGLPDVRTLVSVAHGATIRGAVFCDGTVEHRGTVEGTVHANGLLLRTASSTYRGQLLDAVLRPERPGVAMASLGIGPDKKRIVIQWTAPVHRRRPRG